MQNDVVHCLVSFEMVFPPSFFNITTHLITHLVKEISILGPVFLHNMFPFERYMAVLKKYVRNHSHPEGCIANGYATEEVIEFCANFIDDIDPIGHPVSRHEGRLKGKGLTLGKKANMNIPESKIHKANFIVLQNSSLAAPYMDQHKNIVQSENPEKSEAWITRHHKDNFATWLRRLLMGNDTIDKQLQWLARGPSVTILQYQGYDINGNTYYTRKQDQNSTNQNSGVRIDVIIDNDGTKETYYGVIEEIWELDYGPLKVPLFRCQWVNRAQGGVMVDRYGMTTVDLNKIGYKDEPFVLAKDVTQVFYLMDISSKPKKGPNKDQPKRHIVLSGKRKIVGVEDISDNSEDFNWLDDLPPFSINVDPSILLSREDAPYLRRDHKQGYLVKKKIDNVPLVDEN